MPASCAHPPGFQAWATAIPTFAAHLEHGMETIDLRSLGPGWLFPSATAFLGTPLLVKPSRSGQGTKLSCCEDLNGWLVVGDFTMKLRNACIFYLTMNLAFLIPTLANPLGPSIQEHSELDPWLKNWTANTATPVCIQSAESAA